MMKIIKIKLTADIILALASLTAGALGIVVRDIFLVAFGTILAVIFICCASFDIIKFDNMSPKYVISLGDGDYYDGKQGFTCFAKAKIYKTQRSIKRAIVQIIINMPATRIPTVEKILYSSDFFEEGEQ